MATDYLDSKMGPKYVVGQEIKTNDDETGKVVNGIITEVGDESIEVKWEDLTEPTEYERCKIEMKGDFLSEL